MKYAVTMLLIIVFMAPIISGCSGNVPTASPIKTNVVQTLATTTPMPSAAPIPAPQFTVPMKAVASPSPSRLIVAQTPTPWWATDTPTPKLVPIDECSFKQSQTGMWQVASYTGVLEIKMIRDKTEYIQTIPGGKMFCFELPLGEYQWEATAREYPNYKNATGRFTIRDKEKLKGIAICRNSSDGPHLTVDCGGDGRDVNQPFDPAIGTTGQ